MFPASIWNITSISNDCFENFGVRPQVDLVNKLYGGKHISSASNIIFRWLFRIRFLGISIIIIIFFFNLSFCFFSNGLLDPWSSGGVLKNMSKSVLAVIIPEGAHHLDLRFSNSADPVSVRIARYYYKDHIKKWIKQYHSYHHNYFFKSRSEKSIQKAINVPFSYIR
jgi:lysosomal Pro-X carboxypeptidase